MRNATTNPGPLILVSQITPPQFDLYAKAGLYNEAFGEPRRSEVRDSRRLHTHPVSDECLVMWSGDGEFFIGETCLPAKANDVALAPCGVAHGHRSEGVTLFGGFASPPQLHLIMPTDYYAAGVFATATATRLRVGDS